MNTHIPKEISKNSNLWNYEIIQAFNELYYDGLLTKKDLSSSKEVVIKEASVFVKKDDEVIEDVKQINEYFFIFQKGTTRYLLKSEYISKLPIQVRDCEKIAWNKEGYQLITKFSPVGFKSERKMSFRELVDNFAFFNHANSSQFKLWKIIALTGYMSRINVRVATEPAFGKDSILRLLDDLLEHVGVIQKPTLAKLEHLTNNKLILVNEFVNLGKTETREIEQYLLPIGDFSNKYQKRSRASSMYGGSEEYDTSKLSLILAYNTKECYPEDTTYFDDAHSKQIKERFLPFKFNGKLEHSFNREMTPKEIAEKHKDFYVDIARTIKYYSDELNVKKELNPYAQLELVSEFNDRWKINFETICRFINLYANNEKEYKSMVTALYMAHVSYLEMVDGKNKKLTGRFMIKYDYEDEDKLRKDKMVTEESL